MVEAVLLTIASKILLTIASPSFVKAYDKSSSIWGARKDLEALKRTVKTIQATLKDAETNQHRGARLKNWMEEIGDVLHEADDLFDEVVANERLEQQMKGNNKLLGEVKVQFSKLHPVVLNHAIARKVESIRKRLEYISNNESMPDPVNRQSVSLEQRSGGSTPGWYIDREGILGRDEDHMIIHNFLFNPTVRVIAIVGIAGIGKTTVAQLICGDKEVQNQFEKRWWVNIPDIAGDTEIHRSIFKSVKGKSYEGTDNQLAFEIEKLVTKTPDDPRNYLLILDDVRNQNLVIWQDIIRLLTAGAMGSKIIVTTTYQQVALAMHATEHELKGLSMQNALYLFQSIAFQENQLNDSKRIEIGHQILDKCPKNPLAIKNIAALLCSKPSLEEWESIRDDPKLQCQGDCADSIMSRLRVSFDYLKPEVKSCFAYCSLFPKRHEFVKKELIYLWTAQGYVQSETSKSLESVGNGYFNELLVLL